MKVRKLRSRERVPVTEVPNFRDDRRTVDCSLLNVIGSLQKKHGEAFASEAGLRRMIAEDTEHMPGVDTVRRAIARLVRQGIMEQVRLLPGGVLPDGRVCTYGTRIVWVPQTRLQRRALRARARAREAITNRVDRRALAKLTAARSSIAGHVAATNARQDDVERRRREGLQGLAELAAQWAREPAPAKPPE